MSEPKKPDDDIKDYHEIRIRDIRAINVRQPVLKRIMRIGDIGFSSSAGDEEEVVFIGVANPEVVKTEVRRRQDADERRRQQGNEPGLVDSTDGEDSA